MNKAETELYWFLRSLNEMNRTEGQQMHEKYYEAALFYLEGFRDLFRQGHPIRVHFDGHTGSTRDAPEPQFTIGRASEK